MLTSRTGLQVFVALGLTGLTAIVANGQTSPSHGTQHANGPHCGYFGDGMGYTCEGGASSNSAGVSSGGTGAGLSAAGLTPHTDVGSAYMNAVQGFFNAFAPKSRPIDSPLPATFQPMPKITLPVLIDADSFANAGKDLVSQDMEDLLDDRQCTKAIQYVESNDGLLKQFDTAFGRYKGAKGGLEIVQKAKSDLVDGWANRWAQSSGPDIAREIKFYCDSLNDILSMISPEGEAVNGIKTVQTVTSNQELAYNVVDASRNGVDVIKNAYDRKENVNVALQKVAADVSELALKWIITKKGWGSLLPYIEIGEHLQERAKTQEDGSKYKAEVQDWARKLDAQASLLQSQLDDSMQALTAMNALHNAVIEVCSKDAVQQPVQQSTTIGIAPR